jgi:hypothetical protein
MTAMQFPNALLGPGDVAATVLDNNGAPSNVVEAGQQFVIHAEWTISRLAALLLGGDWQLATYVESIGPGPEAQVGSTVVVPLNGGTRYSADVIVPANSLPDDPAPPISGVYKLATVLTHRNFGVSTDVVGIVEGPMLRIG